LIALTLVLAASACDRRADGDGGEKSPQNGISDPTPDQSADQPSETTTVAPAQPAGPRLNPGDESFLSQTTVANEEEIAATEAGMARGSEEMQELSRMLNGDHIALRDRITELAPGIALEPGTQPPELKDLSDEAFDERLLAIYVAQHEQAIRVFTDASNDPTLSEPVRSLAAETLPGLRKHLEAVKAAQGSE
jgi:predicted outer membrane protein